MRTFASLCFGIILIAVLFSTLGSYFWLLDLFTHFYLQYWVGLALLLAYYVYRKNKFRTYIAGLLLVVVTLELGAMITQRAPMVKIPKESAQVRVFSFNTSGNLQNLENWLPFHAGEFDVVVLLEASPSFEAFLEKMKPSFPHQIHHLEAGPFGIAVLSRWEIVLPKEFVAEGGFYPQYELQIKMPSGDDFSLYAIHAPPPFAPTLAVAHEAILGELAERLHQKKHPSIVVGDLNTTARSHRFLNLIKHTNLRDTAGISPWTHTWPSALVNLWTLLGIRIDQCLLSNSFSLVERVRLEDLGSDHLPIKCVVQIEK